MRHIIELSGRGGNLAPKQLDLLDRGKQKDETSLSIYYSGDLNLLTHRCIAVIGSRKVTDKGIARARKFARELTSAGIVVVSGLAAGVDFQALAASMFAGGRVIGVIGTPLQQAYPAQNAEMQQEIYRDHLLISQFAQGERVFPSNFPERNRTMAAITDGSVIIEASESSGTLHQASECVRLGRWLGISRSVVEDASLQWPEKFLDYEKCVVLDDTQEFIRRVYGAGS